MFLLLFNQFVSFYLGIVTIGRYQGLEIDDSGYFGGDDGGFLVAVYSIMRLEMTT